MDVMNSKVKFPRLRFRGRAMSKFDMAFQMRNWHSIPWDIVCDVLSYDEVKTKFISYCEDKGLTSLIG